MEIKSRVPGKIEEVCVKAGDNITKGSMLYQIEAMKMQQQIKCPVDGAVKEVNISVGDRIKSGAVVMIVE
ncbi:MAG: biotin/lipoyl-containing protein [Lachnospiraceae bacterium]